MRGFVSDSSPEWAMLAGRANRCQKYSYFPIRRRQTGKRPYRDEWAQAEVNRWSLAGQGEQAAPFLSQREATISVSTRKSEWAREQSMKLEGHRRVGDFHHDMIFCDRCHSLKAGRVTSGCWPCSRTDKAEAWHLRKPAWEKHLKKKKKKNIHLALQAFRMPDTAGSLHNPCTFVKSLSSFMRCTLFQQR